MKKLLFLTVLLAFGLTSFSQTAWTGFTNGEWTNPTNWTAGVPDAAVDVNIIVTLGGFLHEPIISTGGAEAKSITLTGLLDATPANLTIADGGTLTVGGDITITGVTLASASLVIDAGGIVTCHGDISNSNIMVVNGTLDNVAVTPVLKSAQTDGNTSEDRASLENN